MSTHTKPLYTTNRDTHTTLTPFTTNNLRHILIHGIPSHQRPVLWSELTNSLHESQKASNTFTKLKSQSNSEAEYSIRKDLNRTFLATSQIRNQLQYYQRGLLQVLKAYANLDKQVSYCQGMGFIVGVLLQSLPSYQEVFYCFFHIMVKLDWRSMFLYGTPKVFRMIDSFKRLLQTQIFDVYVHLEKENFNLNSLSSHFMTIFSYRVPLEFSKRVMDLFLLEGEEFLLNLLLRMIELKKQKILGLGSDFLFQYLQEQIVVDCWREYSSDVVFGPLSGEEEDDFILL